MRIRVLGDHPLKGTFIAFASDWHCDRSLRPVKPDGGLEMSGMIRTWTWGVGLALFLFAGVAQAGVPVGCCVVIDDPNWCCFSALDRTAADCTTDSGGTAEFAAGTCEGAVNNPNGVCDGIGPAQQCSGHVDAPALDNRSQALFIAILAAIGAFGAVSYGGSAPDRLGGNWGLPL